MGRHDGFDRKFDVWTYVTLDGRRFDFEIRYRSGRQGPDSPDRRHTVGPAVRVYTGGRYDRPEAPYFAVLAEHLREVGVHTPLHDTDLQALSAALEEAVAVALEVPDAAWTPMLAIRKAGGFGVKWEAFARTTLGDGDWVRWASRRAGVARGDDATIPGRLRYYRDGDRRGRPWFLEDDVRHVPDTPAARAGIAAIEQSLAAVETRLRAVLDPNGLAERIATLGAAPAFRSLAAPETDDA